MNARQKAKKYKQELEKLKKEPIKKYYVSLTSPTHREVKTLRVSEMCYIPDGISLDPNELDEFYKRNLLELIVKDDLFREAVKFQKEPEFYHPDSFYMKTIKYSATVDVLM